MNTIVMNTLNGAVTEYSRFAFQSITPNLVGSALGLFALGGDTDAGEPIVGRIDTGARDWGTTQLKQIAAAYFSLRQTSGEAVFSVGVEGGRSYPYPVVLRGKGVSRAEPGRGIRENFLSFGFEVPDGQAFVLSGIEVDIRSSKTRRVA